MVAAAGEAVEVPEAVAECGVEAVARAVAVADIEAEQAALGARLQCPAHPVVQHRLIDRRRDAQALGRATVTCRRQDVAAQAAGPAPATSQAGQAERGPAECVRVEHGLVPVRVRALVRGQAPAHVQAAVHSLAVEAVRPTATCKTFSTFLLVALVEWVGPIGHQLAPAVQAWAPALLPRAVH